MNKTLKILLIPVVFALVAAACGEAQEASETPKPSISESSTTTLLDAATEPIEGSVEPGDLDGIRNKLVGQTLADAEQWASVNGYSIRTVEIDGEMFAVTEDYIETRINVALADGKIISVSGLN